MRLHHVWMRPSIHLSRRRRVARLPARSRSCDVSTECSPLHCAFRRWRRVRIVPRGWRRRRRKAWLLRRRWLCDGRDVHEQEALFLFPFGRNTIKRGNRTRLKGNGPGLKGTSTRMGRRNQARTVSRRGKERVGSCILVGEWSRVVRRERIMCARPRDGKTCVCRQAKAHVPTTPSMDMANETMHRQHSVRKQQQRPRTRPAACPPSSKFAHRGQ